jgi:hypothetical protein
MDISIKRQISLYQSWLDLADKIELSEIETVNRYGIINFIFIFFSTFFIYLIYAGISPALSSLALFMHLFLGLNILKARTVVTDALNALKEYEKLNPNVARYLNKEYSLFLVSNGKKPLSDSAIDNLEVHTSRFVDGKMTRGGRSDSIRRFRLSFLKKEKKFYNYLFGALIFIELFIIL